MTVRTINLALQGGGAHGAFTWGVLDRLLEDERIGIEGISGTSAGAINAVVLAQGFADGGAAGARAALDDFWIEARQDNARRHPRTAHGRDHVEGESGVVFRRLDLEIEPQP